MSENPETRLTDEQRRAVEEFRKRHRTALLALLFTDIEGSTALKNVMGELPASALIERHGEVIRDVLAEFADTQEIFTAGDAFFLVFAKPSGAVRFALLVLSPLHNGQEAPGRDTRLNIGIHLGEVGTSGEPQSGGESANPLATLLGVATRLTQLASGGQILMTAGVFDSARPSLRRDELPGIGNLSWLSHGPYLLAGFEGPCIVCEVGEKGKAPLRPPPPGNQHPESNGRSTEVAIRLGEVMNRPLFSQGYSAFERGMMPEASEGPSRPPFGVRAKTQDRPAYAQAESYLAEMRKRLEAQRSSLNQVGAQTRGMSRSVLEELDVARREVALVQDILLPQDQSTYRLTLTNYSTGKASFLDLLDSERALINLRLYLHESRRILNQTLLQLATVRGTF